MKMFPHSS